MAYNVSDVIDKAININYKAIEIIESIECKFCTECQRKIMTTVLRKEVERSIEYYKLLKENIKGIELEEIDFMVYDKISFLVNEFKNRIFIPKVSNTNEYIEFTLNLIKEKYALFIDIKGRLVNNEYGYDKNTYDILEKIIENTRDQIETLTKSSS